VIDRLLSAEAQAEPVPKEAMDVLLSVLVHREWVFASTPKGLYRASPHDKKWVPISTPENIPCVGWLAKQESASSSIYYSASTTGAVIMSSTAGKTFGLYRFDPRGEHWELLNASHNFMHVYVPDDWTAYGIDDTLPDYPGAPPNPYQRVVRMSTDSGKHWQNISGKVLDGFIPSSIFLDPDHAGLICLKGDGWQGGEYVAQADDKSYKWRAERFRYWAASHYPIRYFFQRSLGGGIAVFQATLANYFDHPFGGETEISAFDIAVAPSYDPSFA
jgi:hypothetical protein